MKKIIRLTEQDLHRIVKESVNRVITELDWKTYNNAAREADKRALDISAKPENRKIASYLYSDDDKKTYNKNRKRSVDFTNAAKKAFDSKYGYNDGITKIESDRDLIPMLNGVAGYENGGKWNGKWDDIEGEYIGHNEPNIGVRYYGKGKPDTYYNGGLKNQDASKAYDRAREEMSDYYKGKYNYTKGKGWNK